MKTAAIHTAHVVGYELGWRALRTYELTAADSAHTLDQGSISVSTRVPYSVSWARAFGCPFQDSACEIRNQVSVTKAVVATLFLADNRLMAM
jgi:hypothetical protein